eukprot:634820-Alexandrium_andersonii.AAC.1
MGSAHEARWDGPAKSKRGGEAGRAPAKFRKVPAPRTPRRRARTNDRVAGRAPICAQATPANAAKRGRRLAPRGKPGCSAARALLRKAFWIFLAPSPTCGAGPRRRHGQQRIPVIAPLQRRQRGGRGEVWRRHAARQAQGR